MYIPTSLGQGNPCGCAFLHLLVKGTRVTMTLRAKEAYTFLWDKNRFVHEELKLSAPEGQLRAELSGVFGWLAGSFVTVIILAL